MPRAGVVQSRGAAPGPASTLAPCRCIPALLLLAGCGSRTAIDPLPASIVAGSDSGRAGHVDAATREVDATVRTPDAARPRDSGTDTPPDAGGVLDHCPSLVLAGSPFPMLGNCSTRDGRSQGVAPTSPHITWTASLPPGLMNAQIAAADTSGGFYIAGGMAITSVLRIDAATGTVDWSTTLPASVVASLSPFLDPGGTLVDLAIGSAGPLLDAFSPATGAVTSTPLSPSTGVSIPAIGADGSLYVQYVPVTGPLSKVAVISRILPDGTVKWTTSDLSHGSATFAGFLTLALGAGDTVYAVTSDTVSAVFALDPADGTVMWSVPLPGMAVGGPAVGPDGSIAVTVPDLFVVDPAGAIRFSAPIPGGNDVYAIGRDGTVFAGDSSSLSAVSREGTVLWTFINEDAGASSLAAVTLDANGTVIVLDGDLLALDPVTGRRLWSLPVGAESVSGSLALTSNGGIVVVGVEHMVGASD